MIYKLFASVLVFSLGTLILAGMISAGSEDGEVKETANMATGAGFIAAILSIVAMCIAGIWGC